MSADVKHATQPLELEPACHAEAQPAAGAARSESYDPSGPKDVTVARGPAPHDEPAAVVDDGVLDVDAVAHLLRIGRNTIYTLVARNEIPHRRLGKQIRFSRVAIMRWLGPWSSQGAKEGH